MTSLRHNPATEARSAADLALDAARDSILDVGWSRTTLTGVARRAGVSRMTIYRKWPDMGTLLADLMTREWADLVQVELELAGRRHQLEAFGVRLHEPVLDAVVDHLHVVTRARRADVGVAVGRGERGEDRFDDLHDSFLSADHEAEPVLQSPHATAHAGVDESDAALDE